MTLTQKTLLTKKESIIKIMYEFRVSNSDIVFDTSDLALLTSQSEIKIKYIEQDDSEEIDLSNSTFQDYDFALFKNINSEDRVLCNLKNDKCEKVDFFGKEKNTHDADYVFTKAILLLMKLDFVKII